jgi:hypothetical protein
MNAGLIGIGYDGVLRLQAIASVDITVVQAGRILWRTDLKTFRKKGWLFLASWSKGIGTAS